MNHKPPNKLRSERLELRVTKDEKKRIVKKAKRFKSITEYLVKASDNY